MASALSDEDNSGAASVVPAAGYRSRAWLATLNNYDAADLERLRGLGNLIGGDTSGRDNVAQLLSVSAGFVETALKDLLYLCFVEEVGSLNGVHHLHLYWVFCAPKPVTHLQKYFGNNRLGGAVCPRGSPEQILAYYSKDGVPEQFGANPQPFDVAHAGKGGGGKAAAAGKKGGQLEKKRWEDARTVLKEGRILDLDPQIMIQHWSSCLKIQQYYKDIAPKVDKEQCRGIWVYGKPGCGKSHWAREQALLEVGGDRSKVYFKDMSHKWWDGYKDQTVIVGDDFDPYHKSLGYHLKIWLDRYTYFAELKGGSTCPDYVSFYITSNYSIEECFEDDLTRAALRRRCKVVHFGGYREITPEPVGVGGRGSEMTITWEK